MQLKILRNFYNPISKKTLKANSIIELEADKYGTPINSFWYEQLRFEQNKSYFERVKGKTPINKSKNK
tara:strand:- start:62 stop:265 length:204 start_codon:yes stop_codon:yes gene_type:complete